MKERLTQEDLQKLKHWVEKRQLCKSPHCGEKCIIEPETDNFYKELLKEDEYEDNITSPIIKKFRRAYLNEKYKEIDRAIVDALLEPKRKGKGNATGNNDNPGHT